MEMFTKFYGIDWILFIIIVIHLWMLSRKMREAFLVGLIASCTGMILGVVIWSAGTFIMNFVFSLLHLRAYFKWEGIE